LKFIRAKIAISALATTCVLTATADAQNSTRPFGGTTDDPSAISLPRNKSAFVVRKFRQFEGTSNYATGGVGLRNQITGGIVINGVVGSVQAAYLYWAVIANGTLPAFSKALLIRRLSNPPGDFVTVFGTEVGSGLSPCWGGGPIKVFRGAVPLNVATGNGFYQVRILPPGAGATTGGDPWKSPVVYPLWEGASLVIIGTGSEPNTFGPPVVTLFDHGLSGKTFASFPGPAPGIKYTLVVAPSAPRNSEPLTITFIGADGQNGSVRDIFGTRDFKEILPVSDETTIINQQPVGGPASPATDSDWNGSSGFPLPQLWDDTRHNNTFQGTSGPPFVEGFFNIVVASKSNSLPSDCLTPVANIVSWHLD
jgi:hypothetical protein